MRSYGGKNILWESIFLVQVWLSSRICANSGWLHNLNPSSAQPCTNSSDCELTGQICFNLYDGCPSGQCICESPSTLVTSDDNNGQCMRLRFGQESCSTDVMCREGMRCKSGICRCLNGKLTQDRLYCLPHNFRLLGDSCTASEHICYQRTASGYSSGDVTCSSYGFCACVEGHRRNGQICRRRMVYEEGCRKSYHCEGGAICVDSRCICPTGYSSPMIGGRYKCVRDGAITNVPVGGECDEINERIYCATDLVCHKCASDKVYRCVRFLLANEFAQTGGNGGGFTFPSSVSFYSVAVVAYVVIAEVR